MRHNNSYLKILLGFATVHTHLHFGKDEGLLCVGAVVGLVEVAHGSAVEVHRAAPPHVDALVVPHEGGALATDTNGSGKAVRMG